MIPFKIEDVRVSGTDRGPKASFTVVFGEEIKGEFVPLFRVVDFALFQTAEGEFFSRGPNKVLTNKNGEPVIRDGSKYPVRIEFWSPIWAGERGHRSITDRSEAYREAITEAAVAAYKSAEGDAGASTAPRGRKEATPTNRVAKSARKTGSPIGGGSDDDDDLPF